jgi:hypothetical protein
MWSRQTAGHHRANSLAMRQARSLRVDESPIISARRYVGGPPSHRAASWVIWYGID